MKIYYQNSKPASLLCFIGCIIGVCGIIAFIDLKEFPYLLVAAVGFAMLYFGVRIGEKKDFEIWLAGQNTSDLQKKAKKSITFAMEKYQECPNKYTCEYISKLNPEAGSYIKKDRKEAGKSLLSSGKKNK